MGQKKYLYSVKDEFSIYLNQINDSPEKNYIVERIIGQIDWYDKKSIKNQSDYKLAMTIVIIMSALIPIMTISLDIIVIPWIKLIITVLSSSVTALSAIITLHSFRELWVQYRTNCELLKSELHQYFTNSCDYQSEDIKQNFNLLIEKCEGLLTKEFKTWTSAILCDGRKENENHSLKSS